MYVDVQCNISIQCNPFPALGADRQTGFPQLRWQWVTNSYKPFICGISFDIVDAIITLERTHWLPGNTFLTSEQYQFNAAAVLRVNEP